MKLIVVQKKKSTIDPNQTALIWKLMFYHLENAKSLKLLQKT